MSFLHSCFIENSAAAMEWLESIGYKPCACVSSNTEDTIFTYHKDGRYHCFSKEMMADIQAEMQEETEIDDVDCRGNLPLFKAISAMRDDIGLHQWHKADSIISILWHDIVGNDHSGIIRKDEVFLWDLDVEHSDVFEGDFHKMDLSELINHFKK